MKNRGAVVERVLEVIVVLGDTVTQDGMDRHGGRTPEQERLRCEVKDRKIGEQAIGRVWKVSIALEGTAMLGDGVKRVLAARDALGDQRTTWDAVDGTSTLEVSVELVWELE